MAEEIKDKKLKEARLKDAQLSDDALDNVAGGALGLVAEATPVTLKPGLGEDGTNLNGVLPFGQ